MRRIMEILGKQKYAIFKRIKLHTYRVFSDMFKNEITETLLSEFENYELHHEYYMLLKQSFTALDAQNQSAILALIDRGPDIDLLKKRVIERQGKEPTQKEIDNHVEIWKARKIEPILPYLTEEWKHANSGIVDRAGKFEFGGYHAYHWVESGESQEKTEIDELSPTEVINFVKTYQPEGLFGGLDNSTARKLS